MITYPHDNVIVLFEGSVETSKGYEEDDDPGSNAKRGKREKSLRQEHMVLIVRGLHRTTDGQYNNTCYL